jgi:predicted enzyme related to lactoylglutathione lyase
VEKVGKQGDGGREARRVSGVVKGLGQVALPTHDLGRAVEFYRQVVGLPFIWANDHMAFFQMGDVRLMVEIPEAPEFDHPGSVLYLDVRDIDEAVGQLTARGVAFESGPQLVGNLGDVSVWMAFFKDPDGNLLALQSERPAAAPR